MSHTDKTRPLHVKMWDSSSNINKQARHDHRFGECDLPDSFAESEANWGAGEPVTGCTWEFAYTGVHVCCCAVCHGGGWVRAEIRSERRKARMACRDAVKAANAGLLE